MAESATPPRPVRARYIGYTSGTENHGDEALIWIVSALLAPEIEVVTEEGDADIALLGGGTLINQSPWLIDLFSQQLNRCRHGLVFGTGVGDTLFWGSHFERWLPLLRKCQYVGVRGPHSHRLLVENGYTSSEPVGDPYLAMHAPMSVQPFPRRIAINVGSTNDSLFGGNEEDFLKCVRELATLLREAGWSIVWLSVWSRDLEILKSMRAPDEKLLDARSDSLEALSIIGGCDLFLGEKLHALAMSAIAGTPFIAWEYQPKVRDFAASVGMEDYVVPTSVRAPGELMERLESLRACRGEIAARLHREVQLRRQDLTSFAAQIRHWARNEGG